MSILLCAFEFALKGNRVLFKNKVNIVINIWRINCINEIFKKLKCMDEIKKSGRLLFKNRNNVK